MTELIGDTLQVIQVVLLLSNLMLAVGVFVIFVRPGYVLRVAMLFQQAPQSEADWGSKLLHRLRWVALVLLFLWSLFCGVLVNLINHVP